MGDNLSSTGSSLPTPAPMTTQTTEAVTGSHQLKITDYSRTMGIGIGKHISSAPFSVGSCSWAIQFYPDGANETHKPYISLGLSLCHGPWTTHALFNFSLVDWHETPWKDAESKDSSQIFSVGDVHVVKFMKRKSLQASDYLKDDAFIIHCTVTVMKYPCDVRDNNNIARSMTVPLCKLRQQLGYLLASGLGADVTFQVDEETFHAHRCVLAASSSVFKAQLFSPMKENDMNKWIRVKEIEAPIFKAVLNFIYTDMISDDVMEQQQYCLSSRKESCCMHQHLLVAADRFGLDRLRSTCEILLCRHLDVDNISTILVLAEQHNCRQLKAACLKYISSLRILTAVMATDGYQHLVSSCPWMVEDLNASCQAQISHECFLVTVLLLSSLCVLWIVGMYFWIVGMPIYF